MGLPLLLRGEKLSLLERNLSAGITASQVPDPLYPISRLGDTRPSQLFIFPLRLEDEYFHIDVDQYRDANGIVIGGFENWTTSIPDGHTVNVTGTGAVTEEITSPIFAGSSSMQIENGASGTAEVLASIEVLAGDEVELRYAAQTSVVSSPATLEVFNPYTGKWLTTSGAWSSRRQNAIESVLTVMAEATLAFTVEAFSAVRNHVVSLELRYHMDSAAVSQTFHWDAVRWIPAVDFTSIHAHNMSAGIEPRLVSSDEDLALVPVDRATRFDGSSDYTRSADFTGIVDSKLGTLSFSFKIDGGAGTTRTLIANELFRFGIVFDTSNRLTILGRNSGGATILNLTTTPTFAADGTWHHAVGSWDLANGVGEIAIDGATVALDTQTLTNDEVDYTSNGWGLMANEGGGDSWEGDTGEIWFDPTSYFDVAIDRNVELFRTAGGKAAVLGTNGERVTGTSPILYWTGDEGLTNAGTGGDFETINGTPVVSIDLEAELTKQDVAFYAKLATTKIKQFWKFHMRGTNAVNPIEAGLWNLAQSLTPPWSPRLQGNQETLQFPQTRAIVEASGEQWPIKKAKHARRSARMRFNLKSTSQASFRDELLARTFHFADPIVLVENLSSPKVVHGRGDPESEFARRSVESEIVELIVEESSNGRGIP